MFRIGQLTLEKGLMIPCNSMFYFLKSCVLVCVEAGEAFTWGWKECIPSKDVGGKQQSGLSEQGKIGWDMI